MSKRASIVCFLSVAIQAASGQSQQAPRRSPRDFWNDTYMSRQGREFQPNKFLAEVIRGQKPGDALDIGAGEGRNALYLAAQGWNVTGIDISDIGLKLAREQAQARKVRLEALLADVDAFDYGKERWDLIAGIYQHGMITRNAQKIIDSLKPGGILVVEGLHQSVSAKNARGGDLGYGTNELLKAFQALRVLRYEDTVGEADWATSDPQAPIVRFLARKELQAQEKR